MHCNLILFSTKNLKLFEIVFPIEDWTPTYLKKLYIKREICTFNRPGGQKSYIKVHDCWMIVCTKPAGVDTSHCVCTSPQNTHRKLSTGDIRITTVSYRNKHGLILV